MPEGDTIRMTARRQHAALSGRVLTGFDIRVPEFATVDLSGQTVREVASVGKHLFHRFDELSLHTHLKMEGSWRTVAPAQRWPRPAFQARAVLTTAEVVSIGFELGTTELLPSVDEESVVGHLGPDLLAPDAARHPAPHAWDAAEAVRRLSADPLQTVFGALLDQRNLAGIGNVYANELCFVRGLLPTRRIGEVGDIPALVDLARRMLWANRDRGARSTTGDLRPGRRTWVYGRTGEPCRRCGSTLLGGELGRREGEERVVTWCPVCQR
ncbi:endonuclease VIII Nei2 [Pseudolysinimonas kribbensis]|uniref:DNA-(apurinic or apyrimidinic site) lyase n=1 Tax=Pseudolysinimonas kribbensis TaxID=433641 RepID=A0ABQ6K9D1_9MICO|nr:DNA-formamidopyrimidine glycosylase family protein [Pseudolysinimonas kribbensis]GMA95590.1 putative DNA glycosylase Nei [Pseudolysinimonas kribbensis]